MDLPVSEDPRHILELIEEHARGCPRDPKATSELTGWAEELLSRRGRLRRAIASRAEWEARFSRVAWRHQDEQVKALFAKLAGDLSAGCEALQAAIGNSRDRKTPWRAMDVLSAFPAPEFGPKHRPKGKPPVASELQLLWGQLGDDARAAKLLRKVDNDIGEGRDSKWRDAELVEWYSFALPKLCDLGYVPWVSSQRITQRGPKGVRERLESCGRALGHFGQIEMRLRSRKRLTGKRRDGLVAFSAARNAARDRMSELRDHLDTFKEDNEAAYWLDAEAKDTHITGQVGLLARWRKTAKQESGVQSALRAMRHLTEWCIGAPGGTDEESRQGEKARTEIADRRGRPVSLDSLKRFGRAWDFLEYACMILAIRLYGRELGNSDGSAVMKVDYARLACGDMGLGEEFGSELAARINSTGPLAKDDEGDFVRTPEYEEARKSLGTVRKKVEHLATPIMPYLFTAQERWLLRMPPVPRAGSMRSARTFESVLFKRRSAMQERMESARAKLRAKEALDELAGGGEGRGTAEESRAPEDREEPREERREAPSRRGVKPPSDEKRKIARFYEGSGKTQQEVADILTQKWIVGKSVSQTAVCRAVRAENKYRASHAELGLPQIVTNPHKHKVASVDPSVIDLGERQDGRTRRQRPRKRE